MVDKVPVIVPVFGEVGEPGETGINFAERSSSRYLVLRIPLSCFQDTVLLLSGDFRPPERSLLRLPQKTGGHSEIEGEGGPLGRMARFLLYAREVEPHGSSEVMEKGVRDDF